MANSFRAGQMEWLCDPWTADIIKTKIVNNFKGSLKMFKSCD